MIPDMKPIIEIYQQQVNDFYEGEVMKAVHKVYVNVDKDRLVKAITDAKAFYEEGYQAAISTLQQQETVTNRNGLNEPLTLDELRMMSGDPIFVVTDRLKEWCIVHSHHSDDVIGGGIIMTRRTAEKRTYQYDCYGKTWLAYRQKPEEDDHDERKENKNA